MGSGWHWETSLSLSVYTLSSVYLVFAFLCDIAQHSRWFRKLEMLENEDWFTLEWEDSYGKAIMNSLKGGWGMGKVENAITLVVQVRMLGEFI